MKIEPKTQRYGATALVTGASSGIGEQFACELGKRGFNLLLTARREPLLQALKAKLERDHGVSVTCVVCDLCDTAQVDALVVEEALVLDRDDRLSHDRRDVLRVDEDAALLSPEHREDRPAVRGVDDRVDVGALGRRV